MCNFVKTISTVVVPQRLVETCLSALHEHSTLLAD
jgi:hypothetical protein